MHSDPARIFAFLVALSFVVDAKAQDAETPTEILRVLGATVRSEKVKLTSEMTPEEKEQGTVFRFVVIGSNWKGRDTDLAQLKSIPNLVYLDLDNCPFDGTGKFLRSLKQVEYISVDETEANDKFLQHLTHLSELRFLSLKQTNITDAGLKHLSGLSKLQSLFLSGNNVTDRGLADIGKLKSLESLHLDGTKVSPKGIEDLRKALPKLKFIR
ncbi:leucine-rich repeat domain-containing protein [Rhodopirellula bahusiensis]|uniref:leucine-rich repeat domain-containing protein n=1 Tax=Rhodopirellula bahusiensis TaxID=2014065 RepID=UPI0032677F42